MLGCLGRPPLRWALVKMGLPMQKFKKLRTQVQRYRLLFTALVQLLSFLSLPLFYGEKKEDAECTGTDASSNAIKLYMASVLWRKKGKHRAHRHSGLEQCHQIVYGTARYMYPICMKMKRVLICCYNKNSARPEALRNWRNETVIIVI